MNTRLPPHTLEGTLKKKDLKLRLRAIKDQAAPPTAPATNEKKKKRRLQLLTEKGILDMQTRSGSVEDYERFLNIVLDHKCRLIDVDQMFIRIFELFKGRWKSILAVLLHVDDPEQRVKWMKHVGLPTSAKECDKRPKEAKLDLWVLWAALYIPELYKGYQADWDHREGPKGTWPPRELGEITKLICEVYKLWSKGKLSKSWIDQTIKKCDEDLKDVPVQAMEARALFNSLKVMLWPRATCDEK